MYSFDVVRRVSKKMKWMMIFMEVGSYRYPDHLNAMVIAQPAFYEKKNLFTLKIVIDSSKVSFE